MAMTLDQENYSVAEAAQALGVSRSTIWRWINARRLPAYRVGAHKIRIARQDVAAMVTSARTEKTTNPAPLAPISYGPRTPEEWQRQRVLVAEILEDQQGWSIAPLTTGDLIRQIRDEREERHALW